MYKRTSGLALFIILPLFLAAAAVVVLRAAAEPSGDPEAGLSDSARRAIHARGEATAVAQRSQIVRDFLASGESVASLDRVGSLVDTLESPLSPKEAYDRANVVVRGVVKEQRLEVDPAAPGAARVVSTIEVAEQIKGRDRTPTVVMVGQPGSISLDASGEFVLVTYDFNPPVRLGAEVIAFLRLRAGRYETLPFTDISITSDGLLEPGDTSKEFDHLRGRAVNDLLAEVR